MSCPKAWLGVRQGVILGTWQRFVSGSPSSELHDESARPSTDGHRTFCRRTYKSDIRRFPKSEWMNPHAVHNGILIGWQGRNAALSMGQAVAGMFPAVNVRHLANPIQSDLHFINLAHKVPNARDRPRGDKKWRPGRGKAIFAAPRAMGTTELSNMRMLRSSVQESRTSQKMLSGYSLGIALHFSLALCCRWQPSASATKELRGHDEASHGAMSTMTPPE